MKRVLTLSVCFMSMIFLSACGPIYKTEYAYVPPKSDMGKMCIANCVQAKSTCQQMCQMRNENCRMRSHQEAIYQYDIYRREQRRLGLPIEKNVSNFESTFGCNTPCNCDQAFNDCYDACGGDVLERKVCVAFCDKQ